MMNRTRVMDEKGIIRTLRENFGGDVGAKASKQSTDDYDERMEARILWTVRRLGTHLMRDCWRC